MSWLVYMVLIGCGLTCAYALVVAWFCLGLERWRGHSHAAPPWR